MTVSFENCNLDIKDALWQPLHNVLSFRTEAAFAGVLRNRRSLKFRKIHLKLTPTQVFSYEFCEIFKNKFLEQLWVTVSVCSTFATCSLKPYCVALIPSQGYVFQCATKLHPSA